MALLLKHINILTEDTGPIPIVVEPDYWHIRHLCRIWNFDQERDGRCAAIVAFCAGLLWLAQLSVWWWTERDLAWARARTALLNAEIAGLEDQRDALRKAGLLAKITDCGNARRPCIRVNEGAGAYGDQADYRIIQGY
jgi:hypothetical protein